MNKYFKDKIAERRDSHSLDSTNGFIQGISVGFEFACRHYCEHCKGGDKPQRVSQEQIVELKRLKLANPLRQYWRHVNMHTQKGVKIKPLCKASSLCEAWREAKNESV